MATVSENFLPTLALQPKLGRNAHFILEFIRASAGRIIAKKWQHALA